MAETPIDQRIDTVTDRLNQGLKKLAAAAETIAAALVSTLESFADAVDATLEKLDDGGDGTPAGEESP